MLKIRLLLLLALFASPLQASMVVDRIIVDFLADGPPRQDVTILNTGDEPLYVQVEVLEVSDPGTDAEKREVALDPETIGFIATPTRLSIPPGGRRAVRLVNLQGHGETEQVYRVNLKPVAAPFEADSTVIRVLVGYQLLVFIAPRETRVALDARREGETLYLHNAGNVNVRLYEGQQCTDGQACETVQGRRLYPDNRVELPLPLDAPVSFRMEAAERRSQLTFD